MKKIVSLLLFVMISVICASVCCAEISGEDWHYFENAEVFYPDMSDTNMTDIYFRSEIDENGSKTDLFKDEEGNPLEVYLLPMFEYDFETSPDENVWEIYKYLPSDGKKTIDGLDVYDVYDMYDICSVCETRNGSWIDLLTEEISEDHIYFFYTSDGRGVVSFLEYGVEGNTDTCYKLASQKQPTHSVKFIPDGIYGMYFEWSREQLPEVSSEYEGNSGEYIEVPACSYRKDGYSFVCWTDDYDEYYPGDLYRIPNRDITLRPVWRSSSPVTPGDIDVNGTVDATDRMILARYLADWDGYAEKVLSMDNADVDGNNQVDTADLVILARSLSGWDGYRRYIDSMPSNMIN
ncbi:MAG: hypothetical protein E7576_04545 [Ruminococcaceae bacterium]|jgi:hypothetical protein|nr:hypothetical protein [Oscillospiraceae bacterium]